MVGKYTDVIGLVMLMIIILSITPNIFITEASTYKESIGDNASHINLNNDAQEKARELIYVVLPASLLTQLHGVRLDSLIIAPCHDNNTLIIPKLIPRKFSRTFLSVANATILMPDAGDGVLNANDFLLLTIPIPGSGSVNEATHCSWNIYAAKHGLRERYVIKILRGSGVFSSKGFETLASPIDIAIYFDHDPGKNLI